MIEPSTPRLENELGDPSFWARPALQRHRAFADLRTLDRAQRFTRGKTGSSFYALVRHADVVAASKDPELFSSEPSVTTPAPPRWVRRVFGDSMVNMDGQRHADLRRIVQRAFTPRRIGLVEESIHRVCAGLVDDLLLRGPGDFVPTVAAPLATHVICEMMGIPVERRALILRQITESTNLIGVEGAQRPRLRVPGRNLTALARLHLLVRRMGRDRLTSPKDDLISALVTTDVNGGRLDDRQLGAFFSLLLVAGIETTRNAISHGLRLLTEYPEQRDLLLTDLPTRLAGAVEEILRHSTPIMQFRRNVTRDCEFRSNHFRAGDEVVLL